MTWRAPWRVETGWRTRWTRFDPNSTRAVTQKMFPTKQEMVYGDDLAISSSNFHRNFFGQRFNISSGRPDRLHGLHRHGPGTLDTRDAGGHGNDIERAIARLEALEDELASASEADAAPGLEPRSPGPPCPTLPARPSSSSSIPAPLRRTAPLPPRNGQSAGPGRHRRPDQRLRELAGQAGLRAIVPSAEGDTFCAGIDLR